MTLGLLLAACSPVVVDVDGDPSLEVSPGQLDLGTLFVGAYASADLTVENPGDTDRALAWTVAGEGAAAFVVHADVATVPAGGTVTMTVLFAPAAWGAFEGRLGVAGAAGEVALAGLAQADADEDGHGSVESGGDDCDDADDGVFPGAEEQWYDDVDQDCAGDDDQDQDGDGAPRTGDCDDTDPAVAVPAEEQWNGVDDDCDGTVDNFSVTTIAAGHLYGETDDGELGAAGTFVIGPDVDEDGLPELVAVEASDVGTAWFVDAATAAQADGPIADASSAELSGNGHPPFTGLAEPADVDGDGVADVALGAFDPGDTFGWACLVRGDDALAGGIDLYGHATTCFWGDSEEDTLGPLALADVDGDGLAEVIAGSPYDDFRRDDERDLERTGNVAVFLGVDLYDWMYISEAVQVHGGDSNDRLGWRVAAGDVDGDGFADVLAGAPGDDDGAPGGGAVYLLPGGADLDWDSTAASTARAWIVGDVEGEELGTDVLAAPRDLDGDGDVEWVVGSGGSGRVAVWSAAGGLSGAQAFGDADRVLSGAGRFGEAVSLVDLYGGGLASVLVGAPGDDTAGEDAGAVFVFDGGVLVASILGAAPGDQLGAGLSAAYDLDGDGVEAVVLGAPGADDGAEDGGALWVLAR